MYIIYYFYLKDFPDVYTFTFMGNAQQRRKSARSQAKALNATYKVYKYRKGAQYTSGSFTK